MSRDTSSGSRTHAHDDSWTRGVGRGNTCTDHTHQQFDCFDDAARFQSEISGSLRTRGDSRVLTGSVEQHEIEPLGLGPFDEVSVQCAAGKLSSRLKRTPSRLAL
jgi:hypothetical protein